MTINPETNKIEMLRALEKHVGSLGPHVKPILPQQLVRPNGEPVPDHWTVLSIDENVTIKDYNFKVAYIGETSLLLEPTGPVLVGGKDEDTCESTEG